jgi:enoyl-CoA hydratase/carnithine racemase
LVLRASGPVFSSGHNLKELTSEQGMDHHKEVFDTCNALMKAVFNSPVPVIACVSSGQLAAAAGCQLVSACDIVLAAKGAKFSTPGGNFGLYCSTPGVPLARYPSENSFPRLFA